MVGSFTAGVEYKGIIYYSELCLNAFCSFDPISEKVSFLKLFEKEEMRKGLHSEAAICGRKAWFVPAVAEYFVCVDLDSYEMNYYEVPYHEKTWDNNVYHMKYSRMEVYEDKFLICMPRDIDTLVVIDMVDDVIIPFYGINPCRDKNHCLSGLKVWKDKLYLFFKNNGYCSVMDIHNNHSSVEKTIRLPRSGEYFTPMIVNDRLFLNDRKRDEIVEVDPELLEEGIIDVFPSGGWFSDAIGFNDEILYVPLSGDSFLLFNAIKKTVNNLTFDYIEGIEKIYSSEPQKKTHILSDSDYLIVSTGLTGCVLFFDDFRHLRLYTLSFDQECFFEEYAAVCRTGMRPFFENNIITESKVPPSSLWDQTITCDIMTWITFVGGVGK